MRSLPLVLLALAALLAPAAAFAADPAPTSRFFVIHGLVLGDRKADVMGKLSIERDQLMASVGCNTIGGTVQLDGATLTIGESLVMTDMACLGPNGDLEGMFVKVLEHGPFRIGATEWNGNGASILVEELAATPPGPRGTAPDEPVGSSPGAVIVDPPLTCPSIPPGAGAGVVDDGPASGDSGSSGSTGSGSTGSGSTGSDGVTTSSLQPDSSPGSEPVPPAPPDPGVSAEPGLKQPEPSAVAPGPNVPNPSPPTAIDLPAPAASAPEPSGETAPAATGRPAPEASGNVADPDPGFTGVGSDPGAGKPLPVDPCWASMSAVDIFAGRGIPPKVGDASAEAASSAVAASAALPLLPLAAGLATIAVLAFAGTRRWRVRRLAVETDEEPVRRR